MALQLADIETQVFAERQVVASLVAGRRWPDDADWPDLDDTRRRFAEHLHTVPEPPQPPAPLTTEEQERAELHAVLGVGRRGR